MRTKAIVRLKFPSEKHLQTAFNALEPETKKASTARSRAGLSMEDGFLVLDVEANDTVALRAAMNSYLRWINSAVEVLELLEKQ